ncbi:MAG: hypothetical protein ACRDTI_20930 [Mycobacterium sp.]
MFDDWGESPDGKILRRVDRPVVVFTNQVWPLPGSNSVSLAPPEAKRRGLQIRSMQPGRQVAWVRQSTGEWLACVLADVSTADGQSKVTMQLWLQRHMFRVD